MHILFVIILLLLLIVLVPLLFVGLAAYAKLRSLWYKLTGRPQPNPFSGFNGTVDEIIEDRSKLKVIVVIFGRKTLLELGFTQVTKE